jgi:hypothetical protein
MPNIIQQRNEARSNRYKQQTRLASIGIRLWPPSTSPMLCPGGLEAGKVPVSGTGQPPRVEYSVEIT